MPICLDFFASHFRSWNLSSIMFENVPFPYRSYFHSCRLDYIQQHILRSIWFTFSILPLFKQIHGTYTDPSLPPSIVFVGRNFTAEILSTVYAWGTSWLKFSAIWWRIISIIDLKFKTLDPSLLKKKFFLFLTVFKYSRELCHFCLQKDIFLPPFLNSVFKFWYLSKLYPQICLQLILLIMFKKSSIKREL